MRVFYKLNSLSTILCVFIILQYYVYYLNFISMDDLYNISHNKLFYSQIL